MTVFTFLGSVDSLETVVKAYQNSLGEVMRGVEVIEGNYHITLHDDSILVIGVPEQGENPEKFAKQKEEWTEFYQGVTTEHTGIQESLLLLIERWETIVCIQFQETENEDRTACIFGSALETAECLNGFIQLEDYTLMDCQADIVLDGDGYSDLEKLDVV